jgi:hypothetical protein
MILRSNFFNFIISLDRHRAFSSSGDLALMVSVLSEGIDTYRLAIGPLTWRGGLREIGGQPCAAPNQASAPLSAKVTWRPNSAISDFRHALVLSNGILDLATPRKFSEMLLNLPTEIQEAIVVECAIVRPSMIAALAKTCHALRLLIGIPPDHHLWRSIFLSIFDDPRPALSIQSGEPLGHSAASFDWQREAQRRFRAAIRMDRAAMAEMGEFKNIVDQDAIDALMNTALLSSPVDSNFASEPASLNEAWLENCLQAAIIPKAKTQHLAKLHILASFAHVRTSVSLPAASTITGACRLRSRAYTYDMRNYTQGNHWGPWKPDSKGDVNWEHLWHLINVIRHNAYQRSSADLPCTGLKSLLARSVPKTLDDPVTEWNDWAGVQGVWVRAISFMDYRDLHEYNDVSVCLDLLPVMTETTHSTLTKMRMDHSPLGYSSISSSMKHSDLSKATLASSKSSQKAHQITRIDRRSISSEMHLYPAIHKILWSTVSLRVP